jgi:transposase
VQNNVDETSVRINGKLTWMQIISNENFSLFGRSQKRGTLNDVMNSLIMLFTGVLVHDHLKSYYGYTHLSHAECNVHVLRYLKAVTEIMKHPWAKDMADLMTEANKHKNDLLEAGVSAIPEDKLAAIRENYRSILNQGQKEYDAAVAGKKNITYFDEERRLLNRLRKYLDEHLRFLNDFSVPFSNNGAELGARHVKGKQKTSGGFRSDGGVDNYAVIASAIATLRKQRKHIYSAIRGAFRLPLPLPGAFLFFTFLPDNSGVAKPIKFGSIPWSGGTRWFQYA